MALRMVALVRSKNGELIPRKGIPADVRPGTRVTDFRTLRHKLLLIELGVDANQMAALASLARLDKMNDIRIIEQGEIDLSQVEVTRCFRGHDIFFVRWLKEVTVASKSTAKLTPSF
jgi:hypothetical protein